MRGLGRLIALPFLLIALAVQGFAPAQAQAMPHDAFGFPICSGGGAEHGHSQDPTQGHEHDCCAAACALAGLTGAPPALPRVGRLALAAPVAFRVPSRIDSVANPKVKQPKARGPPDSAILTI
jgi:hypothetical protein